MKAYYTSSTAFKQNQEIEFYKKTVNYLGFKLGQKNVRVWKDTPLKDQEVNMNEVISTVKTNEKSIRECDVFIADITDGSSGVGVEIAMAMTEKKPILILRYKTEGKQTTFGSLSSGVHKNVIYKEYTGTEEITQLVDRFLEDAKAKIDTKFILIIPAEIDKYLSWSSDFRRMHKAQVVREALELMMKKDKDWKQYQKSSTL